MKKNLKITPEGMKDFLFAECSAMDDVCGKIEKVFTKGGFKKVITPGIEFYDIFQWNAAELTSSQCLNQLTTKADFLLCVPIQHFRLQEWCRQDLKTALCL